MKKVFAWLVITGQLFSGQAQAQIIPSIPYNLTNGTLADATQVMGNFNTIVTDTNANSAKNGANSDITSLTGLTTPLANTYGGTVVYTGGTTGGSANAQTLAVIVPSNFGLTIGNIVTGIAGFTNSGATTLNVNSAGATAVRVSNGAGTAALVGGEIFAGNSYVWYFDGTYLILLNPSIIQGTNIYATAALPNGVTATTQSASDSSTKLATTAFVNGNGIPVRTVHTQTFTSSGTYTPTTGMLYADIQEVGGGGGGGGSAMSSAAGGGGGGGAGAYSEGVFSAATIGASQTVTIGAGGAGGVGSTATTGGTTSVGSLITAVGGVGGGSATGSSATTVAIGGLGGASGTNLVSIGGSGVSGISITSGGSAITLGGSGGASFYGSGGLGAAYLDGAGAKAGGAGLANGSGGGGAGSDSSDGNATGGAGAGGLVVITEYCSQ